MHLISDLRRVLPVALLKTWLHGLGIRVIRDLGRTHHAGVKAARVWSYEDSCGWQSKEVKFGAKLFRGISFSTVLC